jgi:hypothetical protein
MCERVALPGGGFAIVCGGRHSRRATCVHCGQRSTSLCDGPSLRGRPGTCDRPLCAHCRIHVPPNADFCKGHRAAAKDRAAQLRLFETEAR